MRSASVPSWFPERSRSIGFVQQFCCRTERREIVARWNGVDEVPELLTHRPIGEAAGEGVKGPKLQPARPLCGGELEGIAQGGCCVFGFSAEIRQLPIDSPQLCLEIALVTVLRPGEPLAGGRSSLVELAGHATSPSEQQETIGQVVSPSVRERATDCTIFSMPPSDPSQTSSQPRRASKTTMR